MIVQYVMLKVHVVEMQVTAQMIALTQLYQMVQDGLIQMVGIAQPMLVINALTTATIMPLKA